jgi:hypothetical protein
MVAFLLNRVRERASKSPGAFREPGLSYSDLAKGDAAIVCRNDPVREDLEARMFKVPARSREKCHVLKDSAA